MRGSHSRLPPKVVVSFTTVPWRTNRLERVVRSMRKELPSTHIIVNVPWRLRRTGETYDESVLHRLDTMSEYVHVNRVSQELGPITKLLPTASNALVTSSDGILVVDDNEYPPGWLSALANAWKKDPAHIMVSFKRPLYKLALKMMRVAPSTLVAGFAGYVVPKRALTTEAVVIMREAAKASTDCLLSDDYVITAALAHVPIRSAGLSYMEFEKFVATLPDDDGGALHKLSDTKKRYSRCLGSMRRTLTPNVVESDGFDSVSPLVLTYAPDHRSQVRNLVASLRKFGYAYKVLGLGEAWKGNALSYLTGVRDELVRLRRSPSLPALVCIVDAYDVIMQSTPSELAKAHAAYGKEILAGV